MSQFDVYINPSRKTKNAYPFLVDVQNQVISDLATRLVVPLSKASSRLDMLIKKLTPIVEIDGIDYLFITQQLTSIPEEILFNPIGTLKDSRDLLIDAMDFAITGI